MITMMKRLFLLCLFALPLLCQGDEKIDLEKYRAQALEKWEGAILEMEERDKAENHPADSILFVGSSSIRLWDYIREDMSPYHPIQRGFGGSKFSDLAIFADRLITPHQFRAVVIFVANDIAGKDDDKTPGEVARFFSWLVKAIRNHNPEAPIFYIAVTPTEKRWETWPEARKANTAIRAICLNDKKLHFIGTESLFLNSKGLPRAELFIDDKLHLNQEGYKLWAAAIKSQLDSVLNGGD